MQAVKQIGWLFQHELKLEWRQKNVLSGLLLYVVSTVFVAYLSFKNIEPLAWVALFWIVMLFAATNAIAKSFMQAHKGRMLYYYTLVNPQWYIIAKLLYNTLLLLILGVFNFTFFSILLGNPIVETGAFMLTVALGCIGLSSALTLVSAISNKASNQATLMAILGFPILLPILLLCIRLSKLAFDGLAWEVGGKYFFALLGVECILFILAYLLFPYLWRE